MWQVVYIASKEEASLIKEKLTKQGFLVKLEATEDASYQIKVPESEAVEVYEIINDIDN